MSALDEARAEHDVYSWHRTALAGGKPPLHEGDAHAGWYMTSVTQGKRPFFPATIFWEGPRDEDGNLIGDEVVRCEIAGLRRDPGEEFVWMAIRPVTEAEYDFWMGKLISDPVYYGPQRTRVRWLEGEELK